MRPDLPLDGQDRIALIDGDIVAYQCAFVRQKRPYSTDLDDLIDETLQDWASRAYCSDYRVMLSRHPTFRHKLCDKYKAHRPDTKPDFLEEIKDYMEEWHGALVVDGLEADDLMGIFATHPDMVNPIIVTTDKDLLQIPGWHFNPKKDLFPWLQSKWQAERNRYLQILMGDSTVGIPGIPGIGPVKADKILSESDDQFDWNWIVTEAYEARSDLDRSLTDMLILATILQYSEITHKPNQYLTDPTDLSWLEL